MRVAFLSVSAAIGGSEAALLELLRGLRDVSPSLQPVVVVPREGPLAERARAAGAEVRVLPMPEALAGFGEWSMRRASGIARRGAALLGAAGAAGPYQRELSALLADIAPDIIHSNGFKLHILASRCAPEGVPVVWHIHEYVAPRRLSLRLLRLHVSRVAAVIANSRSVAVDVATSLNSATHVAAIYNAVDLDEFAPGGARVDLDALAGMPPAPAGALRVGLVATFARWKGHETFMRALHDLGGSDVRGYVIGAPVYDTAGSQWSIEELRAMASSLGVADRVGFTGFVDRPADAMRALDVVVHASTEPEPFGLVIAEGMACGRAVVVSGAGGAVELVEPEQDALSVEPGDPPALARALSRLAADPALRARLGAAGRESAVRRFRRDEFATRVLDVYARAIGGGVGATGEPPRRRSKRTPRRRSGEGAKA